MISENDLIDIYFKRLEVEILPSIIFPTNLNLEKEITFIKQMFNSAKEDIKNKKYKLSSNDFTEEFKIKMDEVIEYLNLKIKDDNQFHELNSTLNEVKTLINGGSHSIKLKVYNEELAKYDKAKELPINKSFNLFKFFLLKKEITEEKNESISSISEDVWEQLAKDSLNKLLVDFDFKSISIMGQQPWIELYTWANDTYKVMKDAQENIGLSQTSAGLNKTINLCYSPDSLFYRSMDGFVYKNKNSYTLFLSQLPYNEQKCIWQHEYTHLLDMYMGDKYIERVNLVTDSKANLFLSHLSMATPKISLNFDESKDFLLNQAMVWTSEAMSMLLNGKNYEDSKEYQKRTNEIFLDEVSRYIVISILPDQEKTWLGLDIESQNKILNDDSLKILVNYLATLIYYNDDSVLSDEALSSDYKEKLKNFSSLICSITSQEITSFFNNSLDFIEKNKVQFSQDIKSYINKFSYTCSGNKNFFPTSESVDYARSVSIFSNNDYWVKPLEVLARASEDLQMPLVIGTQDFHNKNKSLKDSLITQLNKEERIILITAIQSMAKSLGLKIIKEPEDVVSVEKQLNEEETLNFSNIKLERLKANSTASGSEVTSKIMLNIAKTRATNYSTLKNKI